MSPSGDHFSTSNNFRDASVFDSEGTIHSKFNAAVFDSQMVGLAILKQSRDFEMIGRKEAKARMLKLFGDEKFLNMISKATSDDNNVKGRIKAFQKAFKA